MRKTIFFGAVLLGATLLVAADTLQPLKVKTGLWQITETLTWTGLPPQLQAMAKNGRTRNYKSCVKTKDLSSNPWAEGSGENCAWTVLKSTGTDMDVRGTSCDLGNGMTGEIAGKIHVVDSENGTGSFEVTVNG